MAEKVTWPTPLRVGEIAPESLAFWDAVDDRKTCPQCASSPSCRTQWPADIKHRCEKFRGRR